MRIQLIHGPFPTTIDIQVDFCMMVFHPDEYFLTLHDVIHADNKSNLLLDGVSMSALNGGISGHFRPIYLVVQTNENGADIVNGIVDVFLDMYFPCHTS